MIKDLKTYLAAAAAGLMLVSCGAQQEEDIQMQPIKKPAQQAAQDQAGEKPTEEARKDETGADLRNPFLSIQLVRKGSETNRKIRGPLECCDLGQFKLMAMVTSVETPVATVQAPDGKRYVVKIGDPLGDKGGKVIRFEGQGIIVREYMTGDNGAIISTTDTELKLPVDNSLMPGR